MIFIHFYFHYKTPLKHVHVMTLFVLKILLYYSEIQGIKRLFTFISVLILVKNIVERSTGYYKHQSGLYVVSSLYKMFL